jgi:hypothetical protein
MGQRLVQHLSAHSVDSNNKTPVRLDDIFIQLTLATICEVAFEKNDVNAFAEGEINYAERLHKVMKNIGKVNIFNLKIWGVSQE